jgi:putative hemolysin
MQCNPQLCDTLGLAENMNCRLMVSASWSFSRNPEKVSMQQTDSFFLGNHGGRKELRRRAHSEGIKICKNRDSVYL